MTALPRRLALSTALLAASIAATAQPRANDTSSFGRPTVAGAPATVSTEIVPQISQAASLPPSALLLGAPAAPPASLRPAEPRQTAPAADSGPKFIQTLAAPAMDASRGSPSAAGQEAADDFDQRARLGASGGSKSAPDPRDAAPGSLVDLVSPDGIVFDGGRRRRVLDSEPLPTSIAVDRPLWRLKARGKPDFIIDKDSMPRAAQTPPPSPKKPAPDGKSADFRFKGLRAAMMAALMIGLLFLPLYLSAAPIKVPSGGITTALTSVSAVVAARIGLAILSVALWPTEMTDESPPAIERMGMFKLLGAALAAGILEELIFRGLLFALPLFFLHGLMGNAVAVPLLSLISSYIFARVHGYGSLWSRVLGGLIYCGLYFITGTLLWPIAVHILFDLAVFTIAKIAGSRRSRLNTPA